MVWLKLDSYMLILVSIACSYGQSPLGLYQGEICEGFGRTAWRCKRLRECPQIGDFKKQRPTICSFQRTEPIICCPPKFRNSFKVDRYKLFLDENNYRRVCRMSRAIVTEPQLGSAIRGKDALPRVHKHMVMIGYGDANEKQWNCGGSLISHRWVLSAAHCASLVGIGPARWARVGDLDISRTSEDAQPQEKIIIEIIIHPNYKKPAVYNDIALFKLDAAVIFNNFVAPICLYVDDLISTKKATLTGWGRLNFLGSVSAKLQEVNVSLVDGNECKRLHGENTMIPQGIDSKTMICAGEKEGGKDACSGDSGGPLIINLNKGCSKFQIGIISYGKECGLPNFPGVYTRVSYYVPWIESIICVNN